MKKLRECPHCGHHTFFTKMQANGPVKNNIRFNGEEADNSEMHASLIYRGGKYGYCEKCGKRICDANGYAIN